MNEIIQKIQQAMNIAAGIRPRVDQVNDITLPLVQVVNLLADAREMLKKQDEPATMINPDTEPKAEG